MKHICLCLGGVHVHFPMVRTRRGACRLQYSMGCSLTSAPPPAENLPLFCGLGTLAINSKALPGGPVSSEYSYYVKDLTSERPVPPQPVPNPDLRFDHLGQREQTFINIDIPSDSLVDGIRAATFPASKTFSTIQQTSTAVPIFWPMQDNPTAPSTILTGVLVSNNSLFWLSLFRLCPRSVVRLINILTHPIFHVLPAWVKYSRQSDRVFWQISSLSLTAPVVSLLQLIPTSAPCPISKNHLCECNMYWPLLYTWIDGHYWHHQWCTLCMTWTCP